MKWFKHYSNAQTSSALDEIINEFGFEGYGRYWRLLEFLSSNFDGENTSFRFHNRTLRDCLRFKSKLKLRCYLLAIGLQTGFKVVENKDHFEIDAPILLNLKSRDFKKARSKSATNTPRIEENKNKNKIKNVSASMIQDIIKLFNELSGKTYPSFSLAPNALDDFFITTGFTPFDKIDGWRKLFTKVNNSDFLSDKNWCTLPWLVKADNAQKVLAGSYDNEFENVKPLSTLLPHELEGDLGF